MDKEYASPRERLRRAARTARRSVRRWRWPEMRSSSLRNTVLPAQRHGMRRSPKRPPVATLASDNHVLTCSPRAAGGLPLNEPHSFVTMAEGLNYLSVKALTRTQNTECLPCTSSRASAKVTMSSVIRFQEYSLKSVQGRIVATGDCQRTLCIHEQLIGGRQGIPSLSK